MQTFQSSSGGQTNTNDAHDDAVTLRPSNESENDQGNKEIVSEGLVESIIPVNAKPTTVIWTKVMLCACVPMAPATIKLMMMVMLCAGTPMNPART